jgi:hypothetical protein
MSYREPRRGPRSWTSPGGERWRTPRHTPSRGARRPHPVKNEEPGTTTLARRADDEARRVLARSHHAHPDPADDANPQVRAVEARVNALTSRSATRDVSCRHLQSTFQRRAPGLRSTTAMARRGLRLFTRSNPLRPTRDQSRAPVRRPAIGACRDSDAPVTIGGRGPTAAAESPRPLSLEAREEPQVPRSEAPSLIERPSASPRPRTHHPRSRPSTLFVVAGLPDMTRPPSPSPSRDRRWILWARRCSMTSATESKPEHTSRDPGPHAHRDGSRFAADRSSRPVDREPCAPMTEATGGNRSCHTHGPSGPRGSLHAMVQRPTPGSSSTPIVAAALTLGLELQRRKATT